jgi:ribosomal protein L37AE/L43A
MPHLSIIVSFPLQFTGRYCAVIGLLHLLDFLQSQARSFKDLAREAPITKTAFRDRSVYGMTCEECGKGLIAPESSEFVNEQCVRHLWHCINCNAEFEMSAYFPNNTDSEISDEKMRNVFLSDLTA